MKAKVITLDNADAGEIELDEAVFGLPVRKDILARMVNYQLAKRRQGSHKVKGRSEIRGTSAKMFRQKGTGRARHGNAKAPQFRGGGRAHGPVVRDHAHDLPKKVRKLALKTALSAKQAAGQLVILDNASVAEAKTGGLRAKLDGLGWSSVLFVDGAEVNAEMRRAASNLPRVDLLPQQGANVYDILRRDVLALTKEAVAALEVRLK